LSLAKSNLGLSFAVAVTGLLAPILLSLILLHLAFGFTLLQAFTAGAALSATSLGTTFSVISQAGFGTTRLGAVLTSAAVTDDVVGLVLLQVVVSLGRATGSADQASAIGWAVGRPLLASLAMLGVSWFLTRFINLPLYVCLTRGLPAHLSVQALHSYNVGAWKPEHQKVF
jgi:Kef-type K+ transport system membrane component KefB